MTKKSFFTLFIEDLREKSADLVDLLSASNAEKGSFKKNAETNISNMYDAISDCKKFSEECIRLQRLLNKVWQCLEKNEIEEARVSSFMIDDILKYRP